MKVYVTNKFASLRGSSAVTDMSGNVLYKVKGKMLSVTRKKSVYDVNGNLLFKVRNKFFNFFVHKAFIYDAEGNKIARVRDKMFNYKKQYFVEGYSEQIRTDGNFLSLTAQIYRNEIPIGVIRRNVTVFVDKFELEADPRDIPFLIALVIAIDNIQDKKKK